MLPIVLGIVSIILLLAGFCAVVALLLRAGRQREELERELLQTQKTVERMAREQTEQFGRLSGRLNAQGEAADRNLLAEEQRMERFRQQIAQGMQTMTAQADAQREALDKRMEAMQKDNEKRLDQMRQTVDEKLQKTLDERLTQSFSQVSQRLEAVYKGLGEMQTLAAGVGDLKRVLTNVKNRGTWGEIQLDSLLSQMLAPGQYERNAQVKAGSQERVDFAVRMPGREEQAVLLPIDSKYPQEDYQRLMDAQEAGDAAATEAAGSALATAIRTQAKSIADKYIQPPLTTDFAILYLPMEGLYAEVLRRNGLVETLQRDYRVTVAGPTTLSALLTSLQMGFRTVAIEKRSAEVWQLLGAVKTDFSTFTTLLEKTQKQLQTAANSIDNAARKTRTIQRHLRSVEELPAEDAQEVLGIAEGLDEEE